MEKFKLFFERTKLLSLEQFNELNKYATLKIKIPPAELKTPGKICLEIRLKSILPIELFKPLYKNIQRLKEQFQVKFVGNPLSVDVDQLGQYINLFAEYENISNALITNLIQRKAFTISDSGFVIVTYDNKSEFNEFQLIEQKILVFFRSINIFINSFDYQANFDKKEIDAFKKAKEEQIKAMLSPKNADDIQLQKINTYNQNVFINKYKEPITKIADIIYTGENQYVNVSGEIFKITVDTLKNGTQKFVFYISDYDDSIAITVFAGSRKAMNAYGVDVNLPLFYLYSFKKYDWIKARIRVDQNKYTNNETQGLANYVAKVPKPKQYARDDNEIKPRIELLAHTNMSMFDGLIEPEQLMRRIKTYG
jgi:DNA polymerase-3 subunit alpha (Gram-positive type)